MVTYTVQGCGGEGAGPTLTPWLELSGIQPIARGAGGLSSLCRGAAWLLDQLQVAGPALHSEISKGQTGCSCSSSTWTTICSMVMLIQRQLRISRAWDLHPDASTCHSISLAALGWAVLGVIPPPVSLLLPLLRMEHVEEQGQHH